MNSNLRQYVKSFLKENLSDEKYLDKLANDLLKHIAEKIFNKDGVTIFKRVESDKLSFYSIYPPDFDIYKYTLNLDNYPDNIKNWIEDNGLRIIFTSEFQGKFGSHIKGSYDTPKTIYLTYNSEGSDLEDLWLKANGKYIGFGQTPMDIKPLDIYVTLYYKFHSTLLHELRHAFDDYRSKRKYLNTKRWEKHKFKSQILNPLDVNSQQSIKQHSDYDASYLKLAHEINARFSQALVKTRFDKYIDDAWENKEKIKFEDVLKSFKYEFSNWRTLTPKMQQLLTKRLYKYWDEHEVKQG